MANLSDPILLNCQTETEQSVACIKDALFDLTTERGFRAERTTFGAIQLSSGGQVLLLGSRVACRNSAKALASAYEYADEY